MGLSRTHAWTMLACLSLCGCGDGGDASSAGAKSLSGRVFSARTGRAVEAIEVRASDATERTDARGRYELSRTEEGSQLRLDFRSDGHGSTSSRVPQEAEFLETFVLEVDARAEFRLDEGVSLRAPSGSGTDIGGGQLRARDGNDAPARGELRLVTPDLREPASLRALPGGLRVRASGNEPRVLRPLGALQAQAVDLRETSRELELRDGQQMTLELRVDSAQAPVQARLYRYDESLDDWQDVGAATRTLTDTGEPIYVTQVDALGWYAVGETLSDLSCVRACAVDAQGERVAGAQLTALVNHGDGVAVGFTRTDGCGAVNVPASRPVRVTFAHRAGAGTGELVGSGARGAQASSEPGRCIDVGEVTLSPQDAAECPAGMQRCGGRCVDVSSDARHCGSCDNACASALGREQSCVAGSCGCRSGETECGRACVDTSRDFDHCGGCDNACSATAACTGGECDMLSCPGSLSGCGGSCVNLSVHPLHCGACGMACEPGQSCEQGSCATTTRDVCDPACEQGSSCVAGECVPDTATCSPACGQGLVCGSGECVPTGGVTMLASVAPLYPDNGADFLDYVENDGVTPFDGSDTACNGAAEGYYDRCLHGAELRTVELPYADCSQVTVRDALDAFEWRCDDTASPVRAVSRRLLPGKGLSDLIDFSSDSWRANAVIAEVDGIVDAETPSEVWYTNPITVDDDGLAAGDATAGTIYVCQGATNVEYFLDADRTALVVEPGATLALDATHLGPDYYAITLSASSFQWIEGRIVTVDSSSLYLDTVRFPVLRDLHVETDSEPVSGESIFSALLTESLLAGGGSSSQVSFGDNGSYNTVSHSGFVDVELYMGAPNARLYDVALSGGTLSLQGYGHTASGARSYNNGQETAEVWGDNHVLSDALLAGAGFEGLTVDGYSTAPRHILRSLTVVHADGSYGIWADNSSSECYFEGLLLGHNDYGLLIEGDYGTFRDVASVDNLNKGIESSDGRIDNVFDGRLVVGGNGGNDCDLLSSGSPATPGYIHGTCTDSGEPLSSSYTGQSSTAELHPNATSADTFVGRISADDAANQSDNNPADATPTPGVAEVSNIAVEDWVKFDNRFRTWGVEAAGDYPAEPTLIGNCGDPCRIWDWSLRAADAGDPNGGGVGSPGPVALSVRSLPTGDDARLHVWSTGGTTPTSQADCDAYRAGVTFNASMSRCESTFLYNATEIFEDDIGDDDALCESGEHCLHTSNLGAYQGHGPLRQVSTIGSGGLVENVVLYAHEINGY